MPNTTPRNELRARRKAIAAPSRREKSIHMARQAQTLLQQLQAQRIGIYRALPEEPDTTPLIEMLWAQGCALYLPRVIAKAAPLIWLPYHAQTPLDIDAGGILAPPASLPSLASADLQAVITPLVGWNRKGQRLGMGGGFYDRSFADKTPGRAPWLIGYAYRCQEAEFAHQPWDVALDALICEDETLIFQPRKNS